MSSNERSHVDQPEPTATPRRRRVRLLAHLAVLGIAALAVGTVGSSTTGAAPTVQDNRFLAADSLDSSASCVGADQLSSDILSSFGLQPFSLPVVITSAAVEPAPSPGEDFDVEFTLDFTIPQNIVSFAIGLGVVSLEINNVDEQIAAVSGATGTASGSPAPIVVPLGDGTVPVGYTHVITGTFNRTAAVDVPIEFALTVVDSGTKTAPSNVQLFLTCDPAEGVLSMVDQDGVAPSTTTTTRPEVTTTAAPTTTAAVAGENENNQLPVTGSSNLMLVVLALGLIDLGYLALSEGKQRRRVSSAQ